MTWYASQIYAGPKPEVRALFAAHPILSKGMYHLNHLDHFHWPEGIDALHHKQHGLPPDGLLVGREFCAPGTKEFAYHREDAISWDAIIGPAI